MKYFIIMYIFGKQSFGTGVMGCVCSIYPNFEKLSKKVNEPGFSVTNIIEVSEQEYTAFFAKD